MFGSSRCIAGKLLQFGGPMTLPQAAPSLCVQAQSNAPFPQSPLRIKIAADSLQPTADSQRAGGSRPISWQRSENERPRVFGFGFCTHEKLRSTKINFQAKSE